MTNRKWSTRLLLLLWLLFLVLSLVLFFTREWESSFFPTSYATLYYPRDIPTILEWKLADRDRLQLDIVCTRDVQEWKILTDGGKEQTGFGMKPSFRLDTTFSQLHVYRLTPVPAGACQAIEVSVRFYSKEFYASRGMEHTDVYVVRANVPCGKFEQYAIADWTDEYGYVGEEGLAKVDQLLKGEVGISQSDPTFARMEKLFPYLRKKLKSAGGVPKDDERWMNPWLLYNALVDGTGKGWCTQHAQVWVFWANRAGIPTRFVFGARTQDNTIVYTGHAWAESFIPEQHRWAFVDLSQGHLYMTNKEGLVLNTAELFHLNQQNAFDSTFARMYVDWQWENHPGFTGTDTVETIPFALCNDLVRSEFTAHSILKYRRPPNVEDVREIYTGFFRDRTFLLGNLERYMFKPQLAYSYYPTDGGQTYFVRRFLFWGFVGSFAIWVGLTLYGKAKKRGRRTSAAPTMK
jgi:hypothetical protein